MFIAAFLSACGGDGGGDEKRPPAADGAVAPLAANPSSINIRYTVADTHQGIPGSYTRQLKVVDTFSGAVVWQTSLGTADADYPGWLVGEASERQAGSNAGVRYAGPQLLYYVKGGQVFQVDIGGSVTPTSQRISAITDACGLAPGLPAGELDGRHDWLVVRTRGADGDCAQTADNPQVPVFSGMPITTTGPVVPAGQSLFLSRLPNAQGQSIGILTLDGTARRLVLRSSDLAQVLHTLPDDVAPTATIRLLARLPGQDTRGLIQIGSEVRVLDWGAAAPALGPVLTTLAASPLPPALITDAQGLYLANGRQILAFNAAGAVSTLATLPANDNDITGLWLSSTSVLALQAGSSSATPVALKGKVLWSVPRTTGAPQALVQGVTSDGTQVVHVENGLVYYTLSGDRRAEDLFQIRDSGKAQALVASGVHVIATVLHPLMSADRVSLQSLVWCQALPQRDDCSDAPVVSYDAINLAQTTLGTLPRLGADITRANVVQQPWKGTRNSLHVSHLYQAIDGNGASTLRVQTSLWLFNAGAANSFSPILPLAP